MTDDVEQELARMLRDRVADLPASHEVTPATVARVHWRRAVKLGAFATAVLVVVAGTAAAVAQAAHKDTHHITTAEPTTVPQTRPSVDTVRCPITSDTAASYAAPTTTPRVPEAGDPTSLTRLSSFAALDDANYVVLGPTGWSCLARLGRPAVNASFVVYPPGRSSAPTAADAPVAIENNRFDGYASTLACSVFFADLDIQDSGRCLNVFPQGREITRVDAQVSTFVDPDGTRGAGRLLPPSNQGVPDGSISVLTCRPTAGLSAEDCDTIVADWVARQGTTTSTAHATVPTVACPVTYSLTPDHPLPPPSIEPRAVSGVGVEDLASYAATTDERYVVLGPKGWSCSVTIAADGQNGMGIGPVGQGGDASIAIVNDYLWHGGVGSLVACSVSDAPAVTAYISGNFSQQGPCPKPDRTLTRVDKHVTRFIDADGTRGAGWIVLPSSPKAEDGKVSVLTCRSGSGLTADQCDTIIADWIKRLDVAPSAGQPTELSAAPGDISDWVNTANGFAVADAHDAGIAAYDAASDTWRQFDGPPFQGDRYIVGARGNSVYVAAWSNSSTATTPSPFSVLDVTTGKWRPLASVPAKTPFLGTVGDAGHIFGVGAFEDYGQTPSPKMVALEYDVAADRWTKLPAPPLSARAGSTLAWTGTEFLVWAGGSNHQGAVPAFADGAAFNPATGQWRALPVAPVSARISAANVWTGTELLVWGGSKTSGFIGPPVGAGARYNPTTNQWRTLPDAPMRPVYSPAAVWTGSEMVVLGGGDDGTAVAVAAYDPASNAWRSLPSPTPPVYEGNGAYAAFAGGRAIFGVTADGALTAFGYPPV